MTWRNEFLHEDFRCSIGIACKNLMRQWQEDAQDEETRLDLLRPLLITALAHSLQESAVQYSDEDLVSGCRNVLKSMNLSMPDQELSRLVIKVRAQVAEDYGNRDIVFEREDGGFFQESQRQLRLRMQTVKDWTIDTAFVFGIDSLDLLTQGVQPGEIMVLTGSQGSMKTSLILGGVEKALRGRMIVQFFSLDMHMGEIQERRMQRRIGCSQSRLHEMMREESALIPKVEDEIFKADNGLFFLYGNTDGRRWNVNQLINEVRVKMPHVLVIDYLTLLRKPGQSDLECVNEVMPEIKDLAQNCAIRVILLSQMGRASKTEQAKGVTGGHSKGGGIVEELAHAEIELFKDVDPDRDAARIIATVTKNRRGASGRSYMLEYKPESMVFTGYATRVQRVGKNADKPVFEVSEIPREWRKNPSYLEMSTGGLS